MVGHRRVCTARPVGGWSLGHRDARRGGRGERHPALRWLARRTSHGGGQPLGSGRTVAAGLSEGLAANGGIQVAGLDWLGARAYDPTTRGFLSVDPLEPVIGAGWAGNPYSYAGNDPLHAIDPLGLRPVTEDELTAYRESNNGALAAAGDWMSENWEYVVAGAAIVVGVGLMFTGVGGPAGLALMAGAGALVSGGISVASQKHQNGTVDWGKAGVDAAIGGVSGAFGAGTGALVAAKYGGCLAARAAVGASSGAVEGGVSGVAGYAVGDGPHTVQGYVQSGLTGAGIGGITRGVTGYKPAWLNRDTASTFRFGIYRSGYTHGETLLYRAGDSTSTSPWGRFWSSDRPVSIEQVETTRRSFRCGPRVTRAPSTAHTVPRSRRAQPLIQGLWHPRRAMMALFILEGQIRPISRTRGTEGRSLNHGS